MSDAPVTDPAPTTDPAPAAAAPSDPPKPAPPAEPAKANPWDDPTTAQAEIERLRRENAKDRTNAKAAAADEARTALAQQIGKALGLVADDDPVDPAVLTERLTTSQAEAKRARVELAVYRNAATAGADPAALLDSASFLAKVADLDPTDETALTEAITAAVEANPRLGAATAAAPQAPAPNPAQGASGNGAATSVDAIDKQIADAQKAGNTLAVIGLRQQRAALISANSKH